MSEELIRSFIAVDIDDQEVLESLRGLRAELKDTGADIRLVEVDKLHITLRFLGNVPRRVIDEVCGLLDMVEFQPFEVELRGVGVFPSMRRVRVVWVGIERGRVELLDVFKQIESKLRDLGFKADRRGFSPHLTVGRVRSGRNRDALVDVVSRMREAEFGFFRVNSVKLKRSVLTPMGPVYSTIHEASARERGVRST